MYCLFRKVNKISNGLHGASVLFFFPVSVFLFLAHSHVASPDCLWGLRVLRQQLGLLTAGEEVSGEGPSWGSSFLWGWQ